MVLLLLWRHLASYVERDSSSGATPAPPVNMKSTLRLLPPPDLDSLRANAGKKLVGALARLSVLDLVSLSSWFGRLSVMVTPLVRRRIPWDTSGSHTKVISRSCRGG